MRALELKYYLIEQGEIMKLTILAVLLVVTSPILSCAYACDLAGQGNHGNDDCEEIANTLYVNGKAPSNDALNTAYSIRFITQNLGGFGEKGAVHCFNSKTEEIGSVKYAINYVVPFGSQSTSELLKKCPSNNPDRLFFKNADELSDAAVQGEPSNKSLRQNGKFLIGIEDSNIYLINTNEDRI